jgi:molybdopterin molybdotransferase
MVTVAEAKAKIIANSSLLEVVQINVEDAVGYTLAKDVLAGMSLPPFRQSSMDGYAVRHTDITSNKVTLPVVAEARAGENVPQSLAAGTAIRIFTGAPVPEGASAVIMQEHTVAGGGQVVIQEFPVAANKNIRQVGQQIGEGDVALVAGTQLSPGSVGFLLGMNVQEVSVYRKPRVGILVTGDELVQPGNKLLPGQVYESNSAMLIAALRKEGIVDITLCFAGDEAEATSTALQTLSENNDVILASGGISVGDYDFVGKALEQVGVQTVFYKVKQKPGKPLLFGRRNDTLFFALPGNPASSLVCFYEYVYPALRRISGHSDCFLRKLRLPSTRAYRFDGERDEFLKATAGETDVTPLHGQESFALRSFACANALIYLPSDQQVVEQGDLVEVHLLPMG